KWALGQMPLHYVDLRQSLSKLSKNGEKKLKISAKEEKLKRTFLLPLLDLKHLANQGGSIYNSKSHIETIAKLLCLHREMGMRKAIAMINLTLAGTVLLHSEVIDREG